MTSDHDAGVVEQVRRSRPSVRVAVDDPSGVGVALAGAPGTRIVPAAEATEWVAEARSLRTLAERVLAAEVVVAGAHAAERAGDDALLAATPAPPVDDGAAPDPAPGSGPPMDGAAADRQALRFALVILVLAQIAGTAVYLVDGDRLAIGAPAAALLLVAGIVVAHRRPLPRRRRSGQVLPESPAPEPRRIAEPVGVPGSPAVRAAEAHLRRQQAAWKLAWWQRGLPPASVADWERGRADDREPATLVVVDDEGELDPAFHTTMTAAVPAAVRVVLVVPRA